MLIAIALILNIIVHSLANMNFTAGFVWPISNPSTFLIQAVLIYSGIRTLALLTWSYRISILVVSTFVLSFGVAALLKISVQGYPLIYGDIYMVRDALALTKFFGAQKWLMFLCVFVVIIGFPAFILFKVLKGSRSLAYRGKGLKELSLNISSLIVFLLIVLAQNPIHDVYLWKWSQYTPSHPVENMKINGLALNILHSKELGFNYAPVGYSQEKVKAFYSQIEPISFKPEMPIKPDILVIMSESLFDPLQLTEIPWKRDPLKFTRKWADGGMTSTKVVQFGGSTGNCEFEFLTGMSAFYLSGLVAYYTVVNFDQPSIVRNLKQYGYHSTAIHPNYINVYNREKVYAHLGFDNFISREDFKVLPKYGLYPSDALTLGKAMEVLDDEKTSKPQFVFAVTYQNHWPYDIQPFDFTNPAFNPTKLTKAQAVALNSYTKLLEKSDEIHEQVYHWLHKRQRPTIVVLFGDHLPYITEDRSLFTKGLVTTTEFLGTNDKEYHSLRSTPLIVDSNFRFQFDKKEQSLNFLGLNLIHSLNIPMSKLQTFVHGLQKDMPIMPKLGRSEKFQDKLDQYQHLQFAVLANHLKLDELIKTDSFSLEIGDEKKNAAHSNQSNQFQN